MKYRSLLPLVIVLFILRLGVLPQPAEGAASAVLVMSSNLPRESRPRISTGACWTLEKGRVDRATRKQKLSPGWGGRAFS